MKLTGEMNSSLKDTLPKLKLDKQKIAMSFKVIKVSYLLIKKIPGLGDFTDSVY